MDVLVLLPVDESQKAVLEAAAPESSFVYALPGEVTDDQLAVAEVIVGNVPPARLASARRLRFLQLNSAGYDNYVVPGVLPKDVMLASASGAYGQAVSEHLFAMVFSLMKKLPIYQDHQRAHRWADEGVVTTFVGAHVLVLGAGDIGSHFAALCAGMGAHVTGVRRHVSAPAAPFEAMVTMEDLPALLPQADVVASFLPSTSETLGLADAAFFAAMKPGAYFANAGRGDLVDQKALVAALESGKLAGAALDVTSPEPLSADHPLWDAPGALVTPHVSGWFHLSATLNNIVSIAAENLTRVVAGQEPRNPVRR